MRRKPLLSILTLVIGLLLAAGTPDAIAQTPGPVPGEPSADQSRTRTVQVPLSEVNTALRAAGFAELRPGDPSVANGFVTMTHEVPKPRRRQLVERRSFEPMAGPVAVPLPEKAESIQMDFNVTEEVEITGLDFDDNGVPTGGFRFIPPDPHGAASLTHACHVVNVMIECWASDGSSQVLSKGLANFFSPTETVNTFTFDPKILFDQYSGKFVLVTLEKEDDLQGDPADRSVAFLGVSDDGVIAPTDQCGSGWICTTVNTEIGTAPNNSWFDYPGFAVDEEAIYVTGNMFGFAGSAAAFSNRVIIANKTLTSISYIDPVALAGGGGFALTQQPAHTYGTKPAGVGTFLVGYSGLSGGGNEFIQLIRIDNPMGATTAVDNIYALGDIEDTVPSLPGAPQSGTAITIETNDRRTLDAVWVNPLLVTTTILPNSGTDIGEATAYWMELDVDSWPVVAITQQGKVGGEDIAAGTHTFFPSISATLSTSPPFDTDQVAIGFSASGPNIFPGAYYTGRVEGDAPGVTGPVGTLEPGVAFYERTFGGTNRWGDYTGTQLDPSGSGFWFTNQYAMAQGTDIGGELGRWAVNMVKVGAPLPIEMTSFAATTSGRDVVLDWSTSTESNNAGFEIHQRNVEEGNWEAVGFVGGHGTTTVAQTYQHTVRDMVPGTYSFRLKQIDFDGSSYVSQEVEVSIDVPGDYVLTGAYPNPFNPTTQFDLAVATEQHVRIDVFNQLGQVVATLHDGLLTQGSSHRFTIRANDLPSGVYLYRAVGETFTSATRRATLLK